MIRQAGAGAWDALAAAAGLRFAVGFVAALSDPGLLLHTNAGGVQVVSQMVAATALLAAAIAVWGRHPVRRSWATLWAVGAGEFAGAAIAIRGWWAPTLLATLWVLVPATVAVSLDQARRSVLPRYRRGAPVAAALLVSVITVILADLTVAGPLLQLAFWSALLASATASALALRRRPRHV